MRSLRIYYSMLWGALLQLTALYFWLSYTVLSQHYVRFSYTVLSQLCTFSSRILFSHSTTFGSRILFSHSTTFGYRILPSHCSVCLVLVYCPLTALYVWFSYTAISLHYVPFSQLCMCSSCILYYQ